MYTHLYPKLIEFFPEIFEKKIEEKHLMYIMRNAFSLNEPVSTQEKKMKASQALLAKELESLIFSSNYNWHTTDIDGNILLTYPCYLSIENITNKLLFEESAPYDISKYKKNVSEALCASIRGNNVDLFERLNNHTNTHNDYIQDMAIDIMSLYSFKPQRYQALLDKLNLTKINVLHLCERLFKEELSTRQGHTPLQVFLERYPQSLENKYECLKTVMLNYEAQQKQLTANYLKATPLSNQKLAPLKIWLEKMELDKIYQNAKPDKIKNHKI